MLRERVVFQQEFSDCGLACLAMIANHHGADYSLTTLKTTFPTSPNGSELADLLTIADRIGFTPRPVRVEVEALAQLSTPALLHWSFNHYVVLDRVRRGTYVVLDPAAGVRRLSGAEISRHFTGIAVELERRGKAADLASTGGLDLGAIVAAVPRGKSRLVLCASLAVFALLGVVVFPLLVRTTMEFAIGPATVEMLAPVVLLGMALIALAAGFQHAKSKLLKELTLEMEHVTAAATNHLLIRASFPFFLKQTPSTLRRYYENLRRLRANLSDGAVEASVDFFAVVLLCFILLAVDAIVAVALFGALLLHFVIGIISLRKRTEKMRIAASMDGQEGLVLGENLSSMQTIKLNGLEGVRTAIWQAAFRRASAASAELEAVSSRAEFVGTTWIGMVRVALVGLAGYRVVEGHLAVEGFITVSFLQVLITAAAQDLFRKVAGLIDLRATLADMDALLAAPVDPMLATVAEADRAHASRGDDGVPRASCRSVPVLRCADLAFRYEAGTPELFAGVSFEAAAGEIVAVTGPSGAGKSTLMRVLMGLLPPSGGSVEWSGRPLERLTRPELVRYVACVMQEDQFFSGTLIQNITGFRMEPDMERIDAACEAAGVDRILPRLGMGLYTPVFPATTLLSAGEKQRILLARAIYHDTPALVLDEFTSNFDIELENHVFRGLRTLRKTIVMTAHRTSTIDRADRVVRLA